jgi:signal transduction histidine kinase
VTKDDASLDTIVSEVKNLHKSSDVTITLNKNIDLKAVPVVAIEQVISNLIDNGVKYNTSEHPEITLSGTITKDFYSISVADNGVGIPEDRQAHIFEPFKTMGTNDRNGNKGTGMGLATVKKLVEALGGTITVDSTVGKGSIFTFTIRR